MSTKSIRLLAETVREVAAAGIGGAYAGVGTALDHPARLIFVQNLTDETVMFSFDGINDHFPLPSNGFLLTDITSNKTSTDGFFLAEGDRLYVREIVSPTTGTVYFTVFYGSEV